MNANQVLAVLGGLIGLVRFMGGATHIVDGYVMTAPKGKQRPSCPACGYPARRPRGTV